MRIYEEEACTISADVLLPLFMKAGIYVRCPSLLLTAKAVAWGSYRGGLESFSRFSQCCTEWPQNQSTLTLYV